MNSANDDLLARIARLEQANADLSQHETRLRRVGLLSVIAIVLVGMAVPALATPSAPSSTVSMTPCRAVDTRSAGGPIGAGAVRDFSMVLANMTPQGGSASGCAVPATATAVSVNVTVTNTAGPGFASVFPAGSPWPGTSTLNWTSPGVTLANGTTTQLGTSPTTGVHSLSVKVSASSDVIVDITGYAVAATTYTAGTGLSITNNQFAIAPAYRLPQSCTSGQEPVSTGSGTWLCQTPPTDPRIGTNTGGAGTGNGTQCTLGDILLTASSVGLGIPANGQILLITQNEALFNLIGTTYGGDGQTTFALPNLRGLAPNNMTYTICDQGVFPTTR